MADADGTIAVTDDFWAKDADIDLNITRGLTALSEERLKYPFYSAEPKFKDWLLLKNMYLPPSGRVFYYDSFDLRNDGYPVNCSLVGMGDFFRHRQKWKEYDGYPVNPSMSGITISVQKNPPKKCRLTMKNDPVFKINLWEYFEDGIPVNFCDGSIANKIRIKNKIVDDPDHVCIRTLSDYFQVSKRSETILPCNRLDSDYSLNPFWIKRWAAWATSAYYDKSRLWRVFLKHKHKDFVLGIIEFGVDEEKVKSILYARDLPVTLEGRKRPIMHWVSSHKRRMKEGIEIDIAKHLRGVNKFSMFGNEFLIAHPIKKGCEQDMKEINRFYNLIEHCPNTEGVPV